MESPGRPIYDVIIVGGSYAGLAAALQLGRARRSVFASFAVADGVRAGISAHQSLIFRPDGAR